MAIDLEAIKRRIQQFKGGGKSSVQFWKPEIGEYKVRGLPWNESQTADGMPFIERHFYYLGRNRIVAPAQFGKPDPINDFVRKLYSTRDPNDRMLAKKLQSKMTAYMPIIVRGDEEKGVQVWPFNVWVCQRLLGFFTDTDVNPELINFLDPHTGLDLIVKVKKSGRKFEGKDVLETEIDLGRKHCPLASSEDRIKKLLETLPNIDSVWPQKSKEEVQQALDTWLAGGVPDASVGSQSDGTARGASTDALEQLANEIKQDTGKHPVSETASKSTVTDKSKRRKPVDDADIDDLPVPKASIDDVFNEIMQDER